MPSRTFGLSLAALLAMFLAGCNNILSSLCGSAQPALLIGSISPSSSLNADVKAFERLQIAEVHLNGKQEQ